MGDKWTLLIVRDLASGPRRFVELQRVLPGISTEQLRSRLNRMVADGMLTRKRYREVPPRVDYALTERARELMPILAELAKWGYAWAWGAPRFAEVVDIGAIFRLAPGLLRDMAASGTVELRIDDMEDGTYTVSMGSGSATVEHRQAERADATLAGDTASWVAAFSPHRDRSVLSISGDHRLAEQLLDGLSAPAAAAAAAASAVA